MTTNQQPSKYVGASYAWERLADAVLAYEGTDLGLLRTILHGVPATIQVHRILAGIEAVQADLPRLLKACEEAATGSSNDDEINALSAALDFVTQAFGVDR